MRRLCLILSLLALPCTAFAGTPDLSHAGDWTIYEPGSLDCVPAAASPESFYETARLADFFPKETIMHPGSPHTVVLLLATVEDVQYPAWFFSTKADCLLFSSERN